MEDRIFNIAKPIIISLRVFGLFPISSRKGGLKLAFCGLPFTWTIFLLLTLLVHAALYCKFKKEHPPQNLSSTQAFANTLIISVYLIYIYAVRFLILLLSPRLVDFWKQTSVHLSAIGEIASSEFELGGKNFKYGHLIQRLRRRVKFEVGVCLSIATLYSIGTDIYLASESSLEWPVSFILFTHVFWTFMASLHTLLILYLCFFLKIYKICLKMVNKELKSQSEVQLKERDVKIVSPGGGGIPASGVQGIYNSIRVYEIVESMVTSYNSGFGLLLVFQVLLSILSITVQSFMVILFALRSQWNHIFWSCGEVASYWGQLLYLASGAEDLNSELRGILSGLYSVEMDHLPQKLQTKIQLLALKISTSPPKISPWNCFDVNRRLLTAILATTTMYLIILIQFQQSDHTVSKLRCYNNSTGG